MYEIVNADPAPMSTVTSDIDPELDRIVLECLQKEPSERHQSTVIIRTGSKARGSLAGRVPCSCTPASCSGMDALEEARDEYSRSSAHGILAERAGHRDGELSGDCNFPGWIACLNRNPPARAVEGALIGAAQLTYRIYEKKRICENTLFTRLTPPP